LSNTDLSWNGGSCCGYAAIDQVDEAAYVRAVLSDLKAFANIDPSRIYATGFANGAMLSYRLGCEMSDVFAAIAPVEGVFFYYGPCQPRKPVSLIHIHGLKDKVIPYAGTSLPGFGEQYPPVSFGIVTWARLDGCPASPQVSTKGVLTLTSYSPCQSGTAVELFTLEGLGHGWPTGNEAGGISSRTIWEFFAAHPKE
jgi:polyhydroxybutyrate depolymerase